MTWRKGWPSAQAVVTHAATYGDGLQGLWLARGIANGDYIPLRLTGLRVYKGMLQVSTILNAQFEWWGSIETNAFLDPEVRPITWHGDPVQWPYGC